MKEQNAYILGTDKEELYRLGVQHQIWASQAQQGWVLGGFRAGQTLLDLGCGPGFCTKELAFIAGQTGKVLGVDKSQIYIQYLQDITAFYGLKIEGICTDFDNLNLSNNLLDGMYCRWALAWHSKPETVLQKVWNALKPGGTMVIQEYYDWSVHQVQPALPHLTKAIGAALQSFQHGEGDISIGRRVPEMLAQLDMEILSLRPMQKFARPLDATWLWPKSFYEVYFPKLLASNYLTQHELQLAFQDLTTLENTKSATICCPLMIEIVAKKRA